MSGSEPTATVEVSRHVLTVGDPAGTLIELGAAGGDVAQLAAGLEHPGLGGAAKEAVGAISEATGRVEEAVQLFRDVADGSIDISEASGQIDLLLGLLERLDDEGRHREALNVARALSGLLALALRWAELARSLGIAAKAAEQISDRAGVAWAQHELGTLYLAADDPAAADRCLSEAQRLRRELPGHEGLAATEQNLAALCRRLRELLREGRLAPRRRGLRRLAAAGAALLPLIWRGGGPSGSGGRIRWLAVVPLVVILAGGAWVAVAAITGDDDGGGGGSDGQPPTAEIRNPRNGARLAAGAVTRARFGCRDDSGEVTCRATVRRRGGTSRRVNPGGRLPNAPGSYTLVVRAEDGSGNQGRDSVAYRVRIPPPVVACADGRDDDGDGRIDLRDPGCESVADNDEGDFVTRAACADRRDNDSDERIDLRDPGCGSALDNDERDTVEAPACANGTDDDGDQLVDLRDRGCRSARDDDETNAVTAACADGADNDGDKQVDGDDPGCESAADDDETNATAVACADGRDNDGDTLIDLEDPGCESATDDDETNATTVACADGRDNDGDTLIDLGDPGCRSDTDDDETDPPVEQPEG